MNAALTPALVLHDVSRSFGTQAVLAAVNVRRSGPGIIGLLGANGSGKTSLLRVVAQVLTVDAGRVEICGTAVDGDCAAARRLVGFAPHEPIAWRLDTVRENLEFAGRLLAEGRSAARGLAEAALERWQLLPVAERPVRELSRGWAQRYSMARADLLEPPVLLLDEPTTGLDEHARTQLEHALARWRRSRLVIVSSHERSWLAAHCDELLELRDGQLREAAHAAHGEPVTRPEVHA